MNEQKSNLVNMKISLRKKDQEDNLKRILQQQQREKLKLIEKIRDSDLKNKPKEIDLQSIRAEAEKEFKHRLQRLAKIEASNNLS